MALESDLIYDWNGLAGPEFGPRGRPMLDDETLRDGLQSPSVLDPSIEKKLQILHLMEDLGIESVDLGLPGAGPSADRGGDPGPLRAGAPVALSLQQLGRKLA